MKKLFIITIAICLVAIVSATWFVFNKQSLITAPGCNTKLARDVIKYSNIGNQNKDFVKIVNCGEMPWSGGDNTGKLVWFNYDDNYSDCSHGMCLKYNWGYLAIVYHDVVSVINDNVFGGIYEDKKNNKLYPEDVLKLWGTILTYDWLRANFSREISDWCPGTIDVRLIDEFATRLELQADNSWRYVINFHNYDTALRLRRTISDDLFSSPIKFHTSPKVCKINGDLVLNNILRCENIGNFHAPQRCLKESESKNIKITTVPYKTKIRTFEDNVDACKKVFYDAYGHSGYQKKYNECITDLAIAESNSEVCNNMINPDKNNEEILTKEDCYSGVNYSQSVGAKICSASLLQKKKNNGVSYLQFYAYCEMGNYYK